MFSTWSIAGYSYNQHVATVHEEKTFNFEVCHYRSSQKGNLKNMFREFMMEISLKCEVCDYRSSQKGDLNKHVASVHEVNKPFKYDICDYSCSQKSHSKKNVESDHEG